MAFSARGVADSASGGKFWEVVVNGSSLTTTWGKVGDSGSSKTKEFGDEDAAVKEANKLVKSKEKGGYVMEETTAASKKKAPAKKAATKKAPAKTAPAKTATKKKAEEQDDEAPPAKKAKKAPAKKAAKPAAVSPSKKKVGLAGFAAPDDNDDSSTPTLDSGVAGADAAVASNATVYEHYTARLALVEPEKNSDKYYVLQVLEVAAKGKKNAKLAGFYLFTRWGRTGHGGQCSLDGPFNDDSEAIAGFEKAFKSKSGQNFEDADPSVVRSGKYSFLKSNFAALAAKDAAKWEYHLTNDPDGKPDGWYPYSEDGSDNVEALYETFAVEDNEDFSTRFVHSGTWTYKVDLVMMQQTNTSSGTARPIRRVAV